MKIMYYVRCIKAKECGNANNCIHSHWHEPEVFGRFDCRREGRCAYLNEKVYCELTKGGYNREDYEEAEKISMDNNKYR